jgi:hypothetical protein
MDLVLGKNIVVYTFIGGVWKMFACARTASFSLSTSMLETVAIGSGSFANFVPQKHSFTGSIDGLINLDNTNLRLSDFRALQLAKTKLLMRFERTGQSGDVYSTEGNFYITNSEDTGSYADVSTFSITLQGTGKLIEVFTPIPSPTLTTKMNRLEYTGTGGEFSFTDASLIGKDVLSIHKDGLGFSKIILSGTPINKEAKFDNVTGTIEFGVPFEPSEEAYVLYQ